MSALTLEKEYWPSVLDVWCYLDHRELSIPLQSGISLESRSSESLICQLLLCRLKTNADIMEVFPGGKCGKGNLRGLRRTFAKVFILSTSSTLFNELDKNTMCVDDIVQLKEAAPAILHGLSCLANYQLSAIRAHQHRFTTTVNSSSLKKAYERETEKAIQLLRNVQRVTITMLLKETDLSMLPHSTWLF